MVLLLLPTLSAVRNPTGETLLFKVLDTSVIVWKLAVEIIDRVPQFLRDCLSAVHNIHRLAER